MIPPLQKVKDLFVLVTGKPFYAGVLWTAWIPTADRTPFEVFRPYIRPSHQTLLNAVIAGAYPTAFLRQLLRPHGFKIQTTETGWCLVETAPEPKAVTVIRKPVILEWD